MKELSIEEKAKAYDEAIERAKEKYAMFEGMKQGDVLEDVFPELKESEDERIMKALYKMAKVPRKEIYEAEGITKEQALAWLEKQGEQKLTEFEKAVKQVMEEAIECGDTHNLKADAEMLLSLVHKSAWSEEDEKNLTQCIEAIDACYKWDSMIDWLKSLKQRYTWKPNKEQLKFLQHYADQSY